MWAARSAIDLAWGGFMPSAQMLAEHGKFDGFADAASGKALNLLFEDNGV